VETQEETMAWKQVSEMVNGFQVLEYLTEDCCTCPRHKSKFVDKCRKYKHQIIKWTKANFSNAIKISAFQLWVMESLMNELAYYFQGV
jgi:hypothetical protein